MEVDIYELLLHVVMFGIGAAEIKKGVDFVGYLYELLKDGEAMPGKARAVLSLAIALLVPPASYAVLLVDSGLVRYDFKSLVMVTAVSFMSAWGWYQAEKYGE